MRKPRNTNKNQVSEDLKQNRPELEFVSEPPKFTNQEIKTFKQQACEVLDILDKTGNGIYNEGRYGGMYLKHNKDVLSQTIIDKMSKKEDKAKNEDEDNIKLLNFFKKQKQEHK